MKPGARPGQTPTTAVDWDALRQVIHLSTHFLDNVIDANQYPAARRSTTWRRPSAGSGLGVMGWADMLVRLGIPYDSPEGVEMGRRVMEFVNEEARNASEKLAETRGVFPAWEESIWGPDKTAARRADGARVRPRGELRNCNLTTVAPTGTISIFAGCSGRHRAPVRRGVHAQPGGLAHARREPRLRAHGKGAGVVLRTTSWSASRPRATSTSTRCPRTCSAIFRTAHDITPEWHVRMQAAFQEHCDSAISKTTNFPREATEEQVRQIYELAFELGCKGVTVYRDGSREGQVLSTGKTAQSAVSAEAQAQVSELESSSPTPGRRPTTCASRSSG